MADKKEGTPIGVPVFTSAAAAAIVVAAAVVIGGAAQAVIAATAEQQDQDDDPPAVITTETIVTHKKYLRVFSKRRCRSFQHIPEGRNGAKEKRAYCVISQYALCYQFHRPSGYLPSSAIAFRAATT